MAKKKATRKAAPKLSKKQEIEANWRGPDKIRAATSAFMKASTEKARKEDGSLDACGMGDAPKLFIGLRLPGLVLETLFQSNILPLGRMLQLVGKEGSCKSLFIFELARLFRSYSGLTFLKETEDKFSAVLCNSIVGYDDPYAVGHERCTTVDQWQSRLQKHVHDVHKLMAGTGRDNPGVGYRFPVMFAVDSIMGVPMQEKSSRIESDGFANRDHPVEALSISAFLKKFHSDIGPLPFFFVFTNHLKEGRDAQGRRERNKAGGSSISFHETLEIEMSRVKQISTTKVSGNTLMMACYKNCMGDTGRKILVDVLWEKYKTESGELRQRTWFDWNAATTNMLLLAGGDKYKYLSAEVRKTSGLVKVSSDLVYSSRLGISKDSPVSYAEAGALIHQDAELMEELRDQLGILRFREMSNDVDYVEARTKLEDTAAENMEDM